MKPKIFFPNTQGILAASLARGDANDFFDVVNNPELATHVIHVDPKSIARLGYGKEILLQVEPEVVRPDLYGKKAFQTFDQIIAISKDRAERQELEFWIDLPVDIPNYQRTKSIPSRELALVNEHKFSAVRRSKYGLRRKVIRLCDSTGIELCVFGKQWSDGKNLEFRRRLYSLKTAMMARSSISLRECFGDLFYKFRTHGVMDSEGKGLQEFKVSIVIENDLDYVSEKIWKSLYAGSIPVYVGPNLEAFGTLNELVVCASSSPSEILEKIVEAKKMRIIEWRSRVETYLNSHDFQRKVSPTSFWKKLSEVVSSV